MIFSRILRTTLGFLISYSNDKDSPVDVETESPVKVLKFPDDFKFGAASAAYQVEGAWNVDGRGPSIWDTFTHNEPERIDDGLSGDDAALSYYKYKEDVQALKEINSQFYRFSVSWTRILTNGEITTRNQLGIDYYNRLIDELIANGIEPIVTMYHWDLPQPIQDLGGFANPLFVDYFEQFANVLYKEFGDRVKIWATFNEPTQYCNNGYADNRWPPALYLHGVADYLCKHHTILAHARAYHLYRDKYFTSQNGRVGIVINSRYAFPDDPNNTSHVAASNTDMEFTVNYNVKF